VRVSEQIDAENVTKMMMMMIMMMMIMVGMILVGIELTVICCEYTRMNWIHEA
jgi:hypothetical protein